MVVRNVGGDPTIGLDLWAGSACSNVGNKDTVDFRVYALTIRNSQLPVSTVQRERYFTSSLSGDLRISPWNDRNDYSNDVGNAPGTSHYQTFK